MKKTLILSLLLLCGTQSAYALSGIGNPERGKMMFTQRCAMCHGDDGRGKNGMAADFVGEWHRLTKSNLELSANIRSGNLRTPGKIYTAGQCPPHIFNDGDMSDVLSYIRNAFGTPQLDYGK